MVAEIELDTAADADEPVVPERIGNNPVRIFIINDFVSEISFSVCRLGRLGKSRNRNKQH